MSLTLISPPQAEPVSLAELKEHLKVEHSAEDALIAALGVAARQTIEARFRIAIIAQGWRLALDAAPDGALTLPLSPVLSIDAVGVKRNGVIEALAPSAYEAQTGPVGRVRVASPAFAGADAFGGVVISFTAGWANAIAAPAELKLAVKLLAAHFHEHRDGAASERFLPVALSSLVAPYRQVRL